ncbi:MAG: DEAD/DEAH box helicase [Elusimicrobia bacterium]|nr:DEAD/DEAH box helicase [Elusimicrobiota bacterium]
MILRPYQSAGVDAIHDAFAGGARRALYTLPTGGGKTVIFAEIAKLAAAARTRTGILVHRDTLLRQASDKLREFGVPHSIIAPGRRNFGDAVQVASVQTLVRRLDRHEFDFLIPDEGHHAVSPTYQRIFARYPSAHVLGVTATPIRTDGQGLSAVYERLVAGPSVGELIADGYLVEPVYVGAEKLVDLSTIRTRMGDYDQRQLAEAMDSSEVTGDAVEHYRKYCPGSPAVAFCVSIKHAEDVAADFARAGYRAASVSGNDDIHTIRRRTLGLSDGSVQVLASCDLISEGFDAPGVVSAILLRPTKSLVVYLQQVGRALRPIYAPGHDLSTREGRLAAIAASAKPRAVVLDHAGNCFRPGFGFADDEREWTLEGKKKRGGASAGASAIAVRQCPKCFLCHRPAASCPGCGHAYVVVSEVPDVAAGQLVAIDKAAVRRARAEDIRAAETYADLKVLADRIGRSHQWAWRTFCERGGVSGARA